MYQYHPYSTVALLFLFMVKIIKTVGFFGFLWVYRKNLGIVILGAMVLYLAFITGPLGASRFALPVELIIISYASVYFSSLIKKYNQVKNQTITK